MATAKSIRTPAVAGSFYDSRKSELSKQIETCFVHKLGPGKLPKNEGARPKRRVRGGVSPHAGFVYSGPVAAHLYYEMAKEGLPEVFIIIGPNHTGRGKGVSVGAETFRTPLGDVPVDKELAQALSGGIIEMDETAHRFEHSIEVQLPFIQYIRPDARLVPICMGFQDYTTASIVGQAVKKAIAQKDVAIIASTDFSHYVPKGEAYKIDKLAIDCILANDPKRLGEVVEENNITMCGYGPVMALMCALPDCKARLLKYATSGDAAPMEDVVGYAAASFEG